MPEDRTDDKSTLVQVMLGAVKQQTITWANVDQDNYHHMLSLCHSESRVPFLNNVYFFDERTPFMVKHTKVVSSWQKFCKVKCILFAFLILFYVLLDANAFR